MAGLSISGVVSFFLLFTTTFALPFFDLQDWTRLRHKPQAYAPFPTLKPTSTEGVFETRPIPTGTGTAVIPGPTGVGPTAPGPTAPAPTGYYNIKRGLEERYSHPPPYLPTGFSTGTGTGLPLPTGLPHLPEYHHQQKQVQQFGGVRQHHFEPYFPYDLPQHGEPGPTPTAPTATGVFPTGTAPPSPTGY